MKAHRPLICIALALGVMNARAQGIPVIDVANLIQAIQQVIDDATQISNQVRQLNELRRQVASMNGSRGLGSVYDSETLRNYVPADAYARVDTVVSNGYAGLRGTSKVLRDDGMVYNCQELAGTALTRCQAELARPYEYKGLLQDAMRSASGRIAQIRALMREIDATGDQKAALEIQARIGAENAMLSHQVSQIQLLQSLAQADDRVDQARERERLYEMLGRTRQMSDYLR